MPRRRAKLTWRELGSMRLPSDARPSPDGRWVVYVETRHDVDRDTVSHHLRLVDLRTGRDRALTRGPHHHTSPRWSPDSQSIVCVVEHDGSSNLWAVHLDGRSEALTQGEACAQSPCVSPDGRKIAFVIGAPQETGPGAPARVRRRGNGHSGRRGGAQPRLAVLDLGRRRLRLLTGDAFEAASPAWSPDGRKIAFVANRIADAGMGTANSDIFVVAASGGRPRRLTRRRGPKRSPAWSPYGRRIAFLGHGGFPDTVENPHVWVVSLRGGDAKDLFPRSDIYCEDGLIGSAGDAAPVPAPPVWSADGRRIAFLATHDGATNIWEVSSRGGAPEPRSHGTHRISELAAGAGGRSWVFVRATPTSPGEVFVASAARDGRAAKNTPVVRHAQVRRLTRLHVAWSARLGLAAPQEFRIASAGGHRLHGWVQPAEGPGPRRRPAILLLHGGPYAAFGWTFDFEVHWLASRGYHVFYANLRGSVGYGRDFMRALVGKWGTVDYDDLSRIADTLEHAPGVDPARIGLAGCAYGGYLTHWALAHTRRFACAVSTRGISNLVSLFGTSDAGVELAREFDGQSPWESIERWWRASPLAHVQKVATPLLLVHPRNDAHLPPSQSEELFTALRRLGRDVELVHLPGEDRAAGRPPGRVARLRIVADWFERKL